MDTLGKRVRRAREQRGMGQGELSRRLGMKDQSPLSKIERSSTQSTSSYVGRIAEVLGVRVSWLLYGTGGMGDKTGSSDTLASSLDHDSDVLLYQLTDSRSTHCVHERADQHVATLDVARAVLDDIDVTAETGAAYVQSDASMAPTLQPADRGVIDVTRRDVESESGSLFALRRGRSVIVRRVVAHADGRALVSCDSADKRLYPDHEVASLDDLDVRGRLVWSSGKK